MSARSKRGVRSKRGAGATGERAPSSPSSSCDDRVRTDLERAAEILRRPYARVLVPDPDGKFSASIPDFLGCSADGDSARDACEHLEEAAQSWLLAAFALGMEIPEPRLDLAIHHAVKIIQGKR